MESKDTDNKLLEEKAPEEKVIVVKKSGYSYRGLDEDSSKEKTEKPLKAFRGKKSADSSNEEDSEILEEGEDPERKKTGKKSNEKTPGKEVKFEKGKTSKYKTMVISKENRDRLGLNTTMTQKRIDAIAARLQVTAKVMMEREEREWREKVSLAESRSTKQIGGGTAVNPPTSTDLKRGLKK
jgi:hypothetical protein